MARGVHEGGITLMESEVESEASPEDQACLSRLRNEDTV